MQSVLLFPYYRKALLLLIAIFVTLSVLLNEIFFDLSTMVIVFSMLSYWFLLYSQFSIEENQCTKYRLFITVFLYSLLLVLVFWAYSYYIRGNTFLFDETDARLYEKHTNNLISLPIDQTISYLSQRYSYEDWGANILMSMIFRILPDKIFMNIIFTLFSSISSLFVYKIGMRFMSKRYAYLSALSFATSSFIIHYNGAFLKEASFIMFVILYINSMYNFICDEKHISILYIFLYSSIILFYRPAVTAMIIFSFLCYYMIRTGHGIVKIILVMLSLLSLLFVFSSLFDIFNRYTMDGNISALVAEKGVKYGMQRNYAYMINYFAAFLGPFPSVIGSKLTSCFFGSGLMFKLLLLPFFTLGIINNVKIKNVEVYPLLAFLIVESFFASLVQKGMELRITLPHIFVFFIIAYMAIEKIEKGEIVIKSYLLNAFLYFTFLFVVLYNVLRQ